MIDVFLDSVLIYYLQLVLLVLMVVVGGFFPQTWICRDVIELS